MDKVLVLMSTYNGSKYIREQIDSIINQEGVDVSLLVRDDGSTDNTISIVKEYCSKFKNIHLEEGKNLGFAKSFLSLVYMAYENKDFGYFAFADQDDVWLKDKMKSAVHRLKDLPQTKPGLYFSNAEAVDADLKHLFYTTKNPLITKESSLVRYFMLGCTMVFNRALVEHVYMYRPQGNITMHDLWLNQTCVFFGNVVFDPESHILYRQHANNTAGVGSSWKIRYHRLIKSFKSYERRHFREINAKNLLSAYSDIFSENDLETVQTVACYRDNISTKCKLLKNRKIINMGSFLSNLHLRIRILLNIF